MFVYRQETFRNLESETHPLWSGIGFSLQRLADKFRFSALDLVNRREMIVLGEGKINGRGKRV